VVGIVEEVADVHADGERVVTEDALTRERRLARYAGMPTRGRRGS
jgi:hypothetical protein